MTCIELAGRRYPIRMSLMAAKRLTEQYGSLDAISNIAERPLNEQVDMINSILKVMMDAGRAYCRISGEDCPPELECEPAELIDTTAAETVKTIVAAMSGDTARTVETAPDPKNAGAT